MLMKIFFGLLASILSVQIYADDMIALVGGTVIDGTGSKPRPDQTILVKQGRIAAIGNRKDISIPKEAEHINVKGKTILPGFIDLHVHLMYPRNFSVLPTDSHSTLRALHFMEKFRKAGVTTLRDVGARVEPMQALLQAKAHGYIETARLYPVGSLITSTGGHGAGWPAEIATGADGFREAVRKMHAAGFEDIKLSPQYTQEEINAAVDEAKIRNMQVTSHAGGYSDSFPKLTMARRAVDAGVHSLEHANDTPDDVLALMVKKGIHLVPTLSIMRALYAQPVQPHGLSELMKTRGWSMELHENVFKKSMKLGLIMGVGTDAITTLLDEKYPDMYFEEMEYFVELGMSRIETIKAATLNGAIILGRDKNLGSLEKGKWADLQVINGDPLESFDVLGIPEMVMIGGKITNL